MTDDTKSGSLGFSLPEPSPVEHGGRVELRLDLEDAHSETVLFRARWFTRDQALEGEVRVTEETRVEVTAPSELPEWLASFTTALVRTTARKAEAEGKWPRRLTRWRKSPSASASEKDNSEE